MYHLPGGVWNSPRSSSRGGVLRSHRRKAMPRQRRAGGERAFIELVDKNPTRERFRKCPPTLSLSLAAGGAVPGRTSQVYVGRISAGVLLANMGFKLEPLRKIWHFPFSYQYFEWGHKSILFKFQKVFLFNSVCSKSRFEFSKQ